VGRWAQFRSLAQGIHSFALQPRDLSQVNEKGEHAILPGNYSVFVGGRQPGEDSGGVEAKFEITGEKKLPR
jgi:beta-glucosidase